MQQYIKKTIELDVQSINKVKAYFKVNTEKEAVNRALQLVAQEQKIISTHLSLAGKTSLKKLFS